VSLHDLSREISNLGSNHPLGHRVERLTLRVHAEALAHAPHVDTIQLVNGEAREIGRGHREMGEVGAGAHLQTSYTHHNPDAIGFAEKSVERCFWLGRATFARNTAPTDELRGRGYEFDVEHQTFVESADPTQAISAGLKRLVVAEGPREQVLILADPRIAAAFFDRETGT
jgi:hypothetical protein